MYAAAPEATARFFSYVMHLDLTGINEIITWGSFFAGLVFWTIAMGVIAASVGWLYNLVATPAPLPERRRERVSA